MKYLILYILFFTTQMIYSQEFNGQILDSYDEKPISFVNIGILGKNIGTVSDINGRFGLNINSNFINDTIRISCIGYSSEDILIKDILDNHINKRLFKITLNLATYELSEVKITGDKPKLRTLGNPIRDNNNIRIQTDSLLGSEVGLTIRVPKRNRFYKLKSFTINLTEIEFETEVRLNVYNLIDSKPSEVILQKPIFITIPKGADILTIDISDYEILVEGDFFISIENFKGIPSKDKRLKFNGVYGLGNTISYSRKVSQGEWKKIPVASIQFEVLAYEYPK